MIAHLQGTLLEAMPGHVVLDVDGVGYAVSVPLSTYDRLPKVGETCRLLTHLHHRDDQMVLYGFATETERELFRMLIGVSNVGPRLALAAPIDIVEERTIGPSLGQDNIDKGFTSVMVGMGLVLVAKTDERFQVTTGNIIEHTHAEELSMFLGKLNAMDTDALDDLFRHLPGIFLFRRCQHQGDVRGEVAVIRVFWNLDLGFDGRIRACICGKETLIGQCGQGFP